MDLNKMLAELRAERDQIEEAIEARGAIPFYLPAYSPDLNPIEQLFAKLKALLRKVAAYALKNAAFTVRSLCKSIASCLNQISRAECFAYIANSGYGQPKRQSLYRCGFSGWWQVSSGGIILIKSEWDRTDRGRGRLMCRIVQRACGTCPPMMRGSASSKPKIGKLSAIMQDGCGQT